jgi:penicillin-binding protein 1A
LSTKAARKKRPARKRAPRKKPLGHAAINLFFICISGLATLCIGIALAWFLALDVPDIRSADDYRPLVATTVLDRNGTVIDAIYKQYRIVISKNQMPPLLPGAFVAAEDSRYFEHGGLDIWSILRAAVNNLRSGKRSQGGSTITQQVTRALMLSREKTYCRKLTEAILAYRLDHLLSKDEILTIYLNEIYLGEGAYGVEAAARTYFSKKAKELTLAEIAILAGLPQSPSRYSPIRHRQAAKARQRYVLNRMAEEKMISTASARKAYAGKLHLNSSGKHKAISGYFTDFVRVQLAKHYGEQALYREGLTVWTTLDSRLQKTATNTLRQGLRKVQKRENSKYSPQGALIALDTATGNIRALVGGADYRKSSYNRAVVAKRQPGSVFKPLIYAAALEQGLSPDLQLVDAPLVIKNRDGTSWRPQNYNRKFYGPTSLRDALIHSRNIITIKLLKKTGLRPVIKLAKKAGISTELKPELPLALGASPVTLLEMTGAYTVFANQGLYHQPRAITRVRDRHGRVRPWPGTTGKRVLSPKTATTITEILTDVINQGTGKQARGISHAAGKTGTSDDNRDAWFIGYTPKLTTGIWLGHDRGRTLGRGETGGRAAAPIWKSFMEQAGIK